MDAADWLALGRHRFRRGARADGWRALRNAAGFAAADSFPGMASPTQGEASATAGLCLARRLVRRGWIAGAEQLLGWLEARAPQDVRVSVARAILLEWRRHDPQLALSIVEAAQRRMPELAADLQPRRERLTLKAERRPRRRRQPFLWSDQVQASTLDRRD